MLRQYLCLLPLLLPTTFCLADDAGQKKLSGLTDYIARAEPNYSCTLADKKEAGGAQSYLLKLTSQTWQNIDWKHDLLVVIPAGAKPTSTMLLLNTGGNASERNRGLAMAVASRLKAPVAFLFGIP